jgi:aerobic carbon-monoxide dehydrogenase medium subunit
VIPPPFDYIAPGSIDEAVAALASAGDDAKILAGGHSILPLMKLRLASPAILIDLGTVESLRFIRESADSIEIGAMTRYVDLERSAVVRKRLPMLAQAAGLVGDAQVRNRGTIGGAIAHADPAGDLPAVVTALNATIQATSARGSRSIPVSEFFRGIFETDLSADEIVTEIRIPALDTPYQRYEKYRRRLCDWAIVGVAASVELDGASIRRGSVVLTNVGPTPERAVSTERALLASGSLDDVIDNAAEVAADEIEPTPELNAPAHYKKHLARVFTHRALRRALKLDEPIYRA